MAKRHSYYRAEFKTQEEQEDKYIEGYFAVFDSETQLWQDFYEKIDRKAFDNSLKSNDIRCLFNHETSFVLGRTSNKTVMLRVDDKGLYGKIRINNEDTLAKDVYARVKRGDITGCSFGFYPVEEEIEDRAQGGHISTIKDLNLFEISVCSFPAYPQTEIKARQKDFNLMQISNLKARKQQLKNKLNNTK